jgi:hypothetical protein
MSMAHGSSGLSYLQRLRNLLTICVHLLEFEALALPLIHECHEIGYRLHHHPSVLTSRLLKSDITGPAASALSILFSPLLKLSDILFERIR